MIEAGLDLALHTEANAFALDEAGTRHLMPKLPAEVWERLTWPSSLNIPMRFLCRKHPSITFYSDAFCQQRRDLGQPHQAELTDYVDFGRCLNCPGPYLLDTPDGQLVLKRLERLGRRTGQARSWRKRRA
jgi:hypothetical protein